MRKNNGFTLLEIMISLAIIGGLLVTLIYTLNYHLSLAERHETITVATLLAKNKMSDMEKTLKSTMGNFEAPYAEYRFNGKAMESSFPGVLELSVTVSKDRESVTLNKLTYGKISR